MTCQPSNRLRLFLCASVASVSLSCALPAYGQTAPDDQTKDRDVVVVTGQSEARDLDFKVETGSRLGLTNREIPAIVDVLTQQDMQLQGLNSAIDAMNGAPGVFAGNNPGAIGLGSMRGFTRGTNFQYDGVRMSTPGSEFRNWDSWSFERIEVLKGPASVQSGDGALVGTVNFVPKRPVLGQQKIDVLASYGSFGSVRLAGGVNTPLGEQAAARLDVVGSKSDGWVDDTNASTFAANGSVLFRPTDKLALTFSIDHFEDDLDTAYYGTPLISRSIARDPTDAATGPGNLVLDRSMRKVNFEADNGHVESDSTWVRARADYDISGGWKFRNDLSYFDGNRSWLGADTHTFNATTNLIDRATSLITHDQAVWFDRANFTFDGLLGDNRNRFMIGAEATLTDFDSKRRFGTTTSVDSFNPVRGTLSTADTPANFATRQQVAADVDSYAVFVEDAYNVTPDLLLVGGIRFDQLDLSRSIQNVNTGVYTRYGNTYEPTNWRLGAVYNLQPQTQLFAQYSSAVVPVSGLLFISAANSTFNLTTGESYEAGVKSSAFGDRMQLTASVFHIRQDDILTRDPANPNITIQGGSQTSDGVEASVSAGLTDDLRLDFSAALLNAEFDELIEAGGANRSGNTPVNTPEQLADLVLSWTPKDLPVTVFGAVRYNGEFYTSTSNLYRVGDVTLLDAGVTWRTQFADITVRGSNLTDEFYADLGFDGEPMIGKPRSFEVSLRRSF